MFNKTLIAFALLAFSTAASAEAPKEKGFYFGASVGSSVFDDDGANGGFYYDDQDDAFQGYAGFKIIKYFGIEGRVVNFGSYSDFVDTLELRSYSIHAVGYIPFGQSGWELFGQIGYASINQEIAGFDVDDTAATAGGGVRWHINQSFAIGVQADAYAWENDLIGTEYVLSTATTMVSVQMNF